MAENVVGTIAASGQPRAGGGATASADRIADPRANLGSARGAADRRRPGVRGARRRPQPAAPGRPAGRRRALSDRCGSDDPLPVRRARPGRARQRSDGLGGRASGPWRPCIRSDADAGGGNLGYSSAHTARRDLRHVRFDGVLPIARGPSRSRGRREFGGAPERRATVSPARGRPKPPSNAARQARAISTWPRTDSSSATTATTRSTRAADRTAFVASADARARSASGSCRTTRCCSPASRSLAPTSGGRRAPTRRTASSPPRRSPRSTWTASNGPSSPPATPASARSRPARASSACAAPSASPARGRSS